VRAELGIGDDEVVVVTVANYRAQKNYPMLLRAAAATLAECPGARFVAVGQGPLATQIERDHAALALQDRFVLTGYRADATAVIAAGDVFALASDYEGLPVALMEAVALGLPVVATRVGGVAETVGPDAGLLVPPGDVQAFAAALSHLIRERDVRARLQDGARRLGNTFDARTTAGHLAAVYREVRPRPGP
jgi:glycosyltransferase involved in cell wall biosynthesis